MGGAVAIVGPPCSGKTTLGRGLAACVANGHHLSLGDLIRRDRATRSLSSELERAFQGLQTFPPDYLAALITAECIRADCSPLQLIVDGGPPLDRVFTRLGIEPLLTISLSLDERSHAARVAARLAAGDRIDDTASLISSRIASYAAHLPSTLSGLRQLGPLLTIDSADAPTTVALRSLDALGMARVLEAPPMSPESRDVTRDRERWIFAACSGKDAVFAAGPSVRAGGERSKSRAAVLLIKPRVHLTPALLHEVWRRAELFGLDVVEARTQGRHDGSIAARTRAHFADHEIFARCASRLFPGDVLGGYEARDRYGDEWLRAWDESGPQKLRHALWMARMRSPQGEAITVVNGHVPGIVAQFECRENSMLTLLLSARDGESLDFGSLRRSFLGSTDPTLAEAGSLRGDAARRRLDVGFRVSLQNNAFHLSDGPTAALREQIIWHHRGALSATERDRLLAATTERRSAEGGLEALVRPANPTTV